MPIVVAVFLLVGQAGDNDGTAKRIELEALTAKLAGERIVVEGVFSALGAEADGVRPMLVKKSSATFLAPPAVLRKSPPGGNMDVVGVVEVMRGKVVVQVESIRLLADDEKRCAERLEAAGDDPSKLFALASWAEKRHRDYGDPKLKTFALEAFGKAVELRRKEAGDDPAKLAALKTFLMSPGSRIEGYDLVALDHETMRAKFKLLPERDLEALQAFTREVQDWMPGATQRNGPIDPRLKNEYASRPQTTYENADAEARRVLERYFFATLVGRTLELERESKKSPPFDLAEKAKRTLPDYPEFARKWYAEWAKAREIKLLDMAPAEVVETSDAVLRELKDVAWAERLKRDWLEERTAKLRNAEKAAAKAAEQTQQAATRDADRWFELAKQRLAWFGDRETDRDRAVTALIDVLSFAPKYAEAELELRRLGYEQSALGEWRLKNAPAKPDLRAVRTGARPLTENMTERQVVELLGKPNRIARFVSASNARHLWYYGDGSSDLIVVLEGTVGSLRVVKVRNPPAK
jgi:hypothetical protein